MDQLGTSRCAFRVGVSNNGDGLSSCLSTSYAAIIAFMAVATEGSFAAAGDRLGVGRSSVCRSVQKLEMQLGTRLFQRTTRSTRLTLEGERFFHNCNQGVAQIVEAMSDLRDLRQGPPRGLLRISSTVGFGRKVVAPLLPRFSETYPDIALDLLLDDRPADFAGQQIDVAFREGFIQDSSIIAKQLVPMRLMLCASRTYAGKHGLPRTVDELAEHACIGLRTSNRRVAEWEFKVNGCPEKYLPEGCLTFNDPELVLNAVIEGAGIAQLPVYLLKAHASDNSLVAALRQYEPDDQGHYISYLCRQHLPSRIRVFVDFMTENIRALDLNDLTEFDERATQMRIERLAA
jgi:DNA-binding transcriptional LysR family regulator